MKSLKGSASVMLAGVLWGIISIFVRNLSAAGLSSLQLMLLRSWLSVIMLLVFFLIKDRSLLRIRLRDIWVFVGTGVLSLTFFSWCYFTTILESGASVAVVLLYTSPIFVMLMSAVFFRERVTARKIIALIIAFAGCVLVSGLLQDSSTTSLRTVLIGLGSGFGYGLYSIFARYALRRYSALTVTFYTLLLSGVSLLALCDPLELMVGMSPSAWGWSCAVALVCTVAPYIAYTYGLSLMDAGRAATLVTVEPLVGALLGICVYGEDHSPIKLLGMALTLTAVIILNLPERTSNLRKG